MTAVTTEAPTYPQPAHGWTCFHCGETFTTPGSARDHFGATPEALPGCVLKIQGPRERGLLMAIRKAEDEIERLRREVETCDHEAGNYHAMTRDLERYFNGARSVHQAFLVLDFMEGRVLAAEEQLSQLNASLGSAAL